MDLPKKIAVKYFYELKPIKRVAMVVPVIVLAAVSLYIGLMAEHIVLLSERIASDLMEPSGYIQAVLGTK
ncbi:hypothetical protein [Nitritalea halalkaliphila]|uniref:hypothetical protein n=1 Tax=Nitritalea halalkaliphila TaxID=590849 RepID=UPI00293422FF|nr:hypothetical protein [Nitritalea halalkaliphila]